VRYGLEVVDSRADLYVINTCSVTHTADVKSKQAVLKAKKENPRAKVVVCGCLAQQDGDFIKKLDVDYIVPQDKKGALVNLVLGKTSNRKHIWGLRISRFPNQRAFVKIQDGCDKFCSFCKIPFLRGPSRSRGRKEIIEEIKRLKSNHYEIVLCGVNLGLYGKDLTSSINLAGLIAEILNIDGLGRLRLSSLEPSLASDELLNLFNNPKMCPHLHFPFQSGDDTILRLMNKRETIALYHNLVAKARRINPLIAISCDIMTGFPYEHEANFKNTLNFLKDVKPMRMHIFRFSPRSKTSLAGFKIRNHRQIKERAAGLKKMGVDFALEYAKKFLGKKLNMVAEEHRENYTVGYTENYIRVSVPGKVPLGSAAAVVIYRVYQNKVLAKKYET